MNLSRIILDIPPAQMYVSSHMAAGYLVGYIASVLPPALYQPGCR